MATAHQIRDLIAPTKTCRSTLLGTLCMMGPWQARPQTKRDLGRDSMNNRQVYQGTVRTGRGAGVGVMSAPGVLEGFEQMTGLAVLPGTLNAVLTERFDVSLLDYLDIAKLGIEINLAEQGIDYDGELGVHYGRVTIAGEYPGFVLFFTWIDNPGLDAELVSPHHLRDTLALKDCDSIEFTLER